MVMVEVQDQIGFRISIEGITWSRRGVVFRLDFLGTAAETAGSQKRKKKDFTGFLSEGSRVALSGEATR